MKLVVMSVIQETDTLWRIRMMLLTEVDVPHIAELKCRGVFVEYAFGTDPTSHFVVGQELEMNAL